VRAEVCCYVSVQLFRPTAVVSRRALVGKSGCLRRGGAGGYGLVGEVEVEVRCEGAVMDSRAIATRRTDK
jgi:hypothetical protein